MICLKYRTRAYLEKHAQLAEELKAKEVGARSSDALRESCTVQIERRAPSCSAWLEGRAFSAGKEPWWVQ